MTDRHEHELGHVVIQPTTILGPNGQPITQGMRTLDYGDGQRDLAPKGLKAAGRWPRGTSYSYRPGKQGARERARRQRQRDHQQSKAARRAARFAQERVGTVPGAALATADDGGLVAATRVMSVDEAVQEWGPAKP